MGSGVLLSEELGAGGKYAWMERLVLLVGPIASHMRFLCTTMNMQGILAMERPDEKVRLCATYCKSSRGERRSFPRSSDTSNSSITGTSSFVLLRSRKSGTSCRVC